MGRSFSFIHKITPQRQKPIPKNPFLIIGLIKGALFHFIKITTVLQGISIARFSHRIALCGNGAQLNILNWNMDDI
jgi:hypothetical protein